jgi:DNA polymerase I
MPIVSTQNLRPGELRADNLQIYNGLDCMITLEVFEALGQLFNEEPVMYGFERALQAPALEMMLRGFLVDETERHAGVKLLQTNLAQLDSLLQRYAYAVWDKPLNPRSHKQLIDFFYGAMALPEIWTSKKGERKLSMDREALEKLEVYFYAMPIIATILQIRDITKQLEVLQTEIDADGRIRTSYNIAGTDTDRWSSSANAFGTGGNLQNWRERLRKILIADPGWKLCGIDLEQTESRDVGWIVGTLFDDWAYLDACEAGDLHTTVCQMVWPELAWTKDKKKNREVAESPFYRDYTYRYMAKRGGHGSNYLGTPWTMARHLKVPVKVVERFQNLYFTAFPGIPRWHRWVAEQLQTIGRIGDTFGRERTFFGRPNDDTTIRAAVAHGPQSTTAKRLNLGLYRVWEQMGKTVQLLAQVHDAVYFQYRVEDGEAEIINRALKLIEVEHQHNDRRMIVPGEAKVGWNWGNHHDESKPISQSNLANPNGLKKWKGSDSRQRLTGLDRIL